MIYGIYGHMMCGNVWKIYIWEYHLNIEPIISIITIRKNFTKAYGHIIRGNLYVI